MAYKSLDIDRVHLTISGVLFPDLKTLNSAANAIGSNMFEGFEPTKKSISIIRDFLLGKISSKEIIEISKNKMYE